MTHEPIGKRSVESDSAKWARKLDEAEERSSVLVNPAEAEAEREDATEAAIAGIVGPEKARSLAAGMPPANEPELTAHEASMLRRAARDRGR